MEIARRLALCSLSYLDDNEAGSTAVGALEVDCALIMRYVEALNSGLHSHQSQSDEQERHGKLHDGLDVGMAQQSSGASLGAETDLGVGLQSMT